LSVFKYATILAPSQNKKLSGKHRFLPFIATNNVVYSTNNNPNQLHTKVKAKKNILKHIIIICISNKKCKRKKGNGMIQIAYLKRGAYYEHWHYHYTYTGGPRIIS
jgi:hypothetical protein